jgi:hypothetical protein
LATIDQLKLSALTGSNIGRTQNTASTSGNEFKKVLKSITNVPENLEGIFAEAANKYGISEKLLKAVAKVESNFNAQATSKKGAAGIMQLMPATAKSLGVMNPYDARSNIMGGAKYLKEHLERFDGNIDLTLAAYNAGGNNVKKYGGIPPFKETQEYVKKVKNYMGNPESINTGSLYFSDNSKSSNNNINATASNYSSYSPQGMSGINELYQTLTSLSGQSSETGENSLSTNKTNYLYLIELMKMRMQMSSYSLGGSQDNSTNSTNGII